MLCSCTGEGQGETDADDIRQVSSLFPECNVWSSLEQNYNLLKSMLSQKYGVPTEVVEQFHGSPVPKTNNDKLFELSMDRCTWYTLYETPKGDIKLSLQKGIMENILFR